MVLQEWSPDLALNDITFRCSPFWIQVHNISLNRMNRENSYKFENFIRTFIKMDKGLEDLRIKSYLRVQVSVDITKSLKSCVFIRNEDGTTRWLAFKYERLSNFCFNWGKLGYTSSHCLSTTPPSYGATDPRHAYDTWMRANNSENFQPPESYPSELEHSPRQQLAGETTMAVFTSVEGKLVPNHLSHPSCVYESPKSRLVRNPNPLLDITNMVNLEIPSTLYCH